MKVWKSPIRILLLYLCFLVVWANFNWAGFDLNFWFTQIFHFALLLAPGWLLYSAFLRNNVVNPTRWEHRVITALILFLLFDVLFSWWVFLTVGLVTEVIQRFVRLPTGPVVNPAATGVVALSLFGQFPTWWGMNFGPRFEFMPGNISLIMIFTTLIAGYVAWKYHKLLIVAAATISFSIVYYLIFRSSPISILVDGTFAFFLLVMVIEPKTSPAIQQQQAGYGGLVGGTVAVLLGAAYYSFWVEAYTSALLMSNIVFNLYKNRMFLKNKWKSHIAPVATNAQHFLRKLW